MLATRTFWLGCATTLAACNALWGMGELRFESAQGGAAEPQGGGAAGGGSGAGGATGTTSATGGGGGAGATGGGQGATGGGPPGCTPACAMGLACCYGVCVNQLNDINNCGACGMKCGGGHPFCDNGACGVAPCDDSAPCGPGPDGPCCGTACCSTGELCCEVKTGGQTPTPGCVAPTPNGSCPPGCPSCD